ncbi:hypothetical protein HMPREF0083_03975 [Aneurinibacillus aneurinilyticus ATCC 12856]|uniref:Uncharacterized protein n=1 Tax=Aneurinibacillus aneurinilyticus ATCC 12856 TaxID=649747 RepID=U1Y720_ANEAE|nr:hypothetical protein HMPREF0083_03975 [Aneurinibacillus aneurinilyticus ATCC 12856]
MLHEYLKNFPALTGSNILTSRFGQIDEAQAEDKLPLKVRYVKLTRNRK